VLLHALNNCHGVVDAEREWFSYNPDVTGLGFERIDGGFESILLKAYTLQQQEYVTLSQYYRGAIGRASTLNLSFKLPKQNEFCMFLYCVLC
jgi:hypothetical protein